MGNGFLNHAMICVFNVVLKTTLFRDLSLNITNILVKIEY